jgi:type IV pilus assembly protein PilA
MSNWYISRNENRIGPITEDVLKQMVNASQISAADVVWTEGQAEWQRADSFAWFSNAPQINQEPPNLITPIQQIPFSTPDAPPSLVVWSVLMIVLCGLVGIIGGVIGLIKDSNAKSAFGRGDNQAAQKAYRSGKNWLIGTFIFNLAVFPILMLIAIPTNQALFRNVHELSAKKSMQVIQQAEMIYQQTYPDAGYACSLEALGGDPSQGHPSSANAQLIKTDLASGIKDGYIFNIVNCTKVTVGNQERITSYQITAVPENLGKTGTLGFCLDSFGKMKADPDGGNNCTQDVQ